MNRNSSGFTLVELMMVILLLALVIMAASTVFVSLVTQSGVQGSIAQSHESSIGLDMLKRDIEGAGFGLYSTGTVTYSESTANPFGLNNAPAGVPRSIVSRNAAAYAAPNDVFDGSDYLIVRSAATARNEPSRKWTYVRAGNVVKEWMPAQERFDNNDRVAVIWPRADGTRSLVTTTAGAYYTTYQNLADPAVDRLANAAFAPVDENETYVMYGINAAGASLPARPFNRADYYIAVAPDMPDRCAPNTGILYKGYLNHDAGGTLDEQPIVDCVADMQVIFGLDNDVDGDFQPGVGGSTDGYSNAINGLTADQIRQQVKEVRIYILTHEGQRDRNYTHAVTNITVGEFGLGRTVNIGANVNYRWKVYQFSVKSLMW